MDDKILVETWRSPQDAWVAANLTFQGVTQSGKKPGVKF